jgi:hypothetical protein
MNAGQRHLSDELCERMRRGTVWLTEQMKLFLAGNGEAVTDAEWGDAVALWLGLEDTLRQVTGDDRCIYRGECPEDAPLHCHGCS